MFFPFCEGVARPSCAVHRSGAWQGTSSSQRQSRGPYWRLRLLLESFRFRKAEALSASFRPPSRGKTLSKNPARQAFFCSLSSTFASCILPAFRPSMVSSRIFLFCIIVVRPILRNAVTSLSISEDVYEVCINLSFPSRNEEVQHRKSGRRSPQEAVQFLLFGRSPP